MRRNEHVSFSLQKITQSSKSDVLKVFKAGYDSANQVKKWSERPRDT